MKTMLKPYVGLLAALLFQWQTNAQAPVNNPLTGWAKQQGEWTNALPWKKTVYANAINGLINQNNYIDSALLSQTLNGLSQGGGGVLYFSSGTFYLATDLPLPANVIIRGEGQSVPQPGSGLLTKLVFPKLYLARNRAPETIEPGSLTTKKIYYNGNATGFAALVMLEINRATIMLGSEEKPAGNVLVYAVRQNNAALLDASVPTAFQEANRGGWQVWPDRAAANINIHYSGKCLVAGNVLNDAITDNLAQPDYMTNDGMRFDGSRAEFRYTTHPGLQIATSGSDKNAIAAVGENTVFISGGYEPFVVAGEKTMVKNTAKTIAEKDNGVADGKTAAVQTYNLLYKDEVPSESLLFTNEYHDTLPYRLIKPANYDPSKKYPLVVFLHDFWEKGSDNKRQLRQFIWQLVTPENREKYPCFIIAPQLPPSEPKWKTDGLGSETWPIQCCSQLIADMQKRFSIDAQRVYATGNSMGGAGAVNLAIHHPDQIAAVVGISVFYRLTKNSALQINKIPLWLIYGEKDDRIEPTVKLSIRTDLRNAKAVYKMTDIPNMGHRCWNDIHSELPDLTGWLFAQHKQ